MPLFKKGERLTGRDALNGLFDDSNSFFVYPFKVVWKQTDRSGFPARVVVSVPKKRFKRAVKRNHIKRKVKEVYRLHKDPLYLALNDIDMKIDFALLYVADSVCEYSFIEKKLKKIISRLSKDIGKFKK